MADSCTMQLMRILLGSHNGRTTAADFQGQMVRLVRSLGLHAPDRTPCGRPVSVAEAHALLELTQQAPLSQTQLSRRLALEKSTVSRLVAALARRRWIKRARSDGDGRALLLSLTAAGRKAASRLADSRRRMFSRLFRGIPSADRASVLRAVDTLVKVIYENR
jgi:DNA-binding MarR family transcriptional regulator